MNDLFRHISEKWSHLSAKKIFLACSGGVDSMTLLSIFHKAKWNVEVLHVNYQLRGQDSEDDQKLVSETCERLKIPFHLHRINLQSKLNEVGGNLQETARVVRYDFFEKKRSVSENNYIALGHHNDDQIETFFMHLARKSGIMGMACMPAEHDRFIRPLLPFSKEEIIQYAKTNGIVWREDYSNKTNKYVRNILRNVILPDLQKQIPDLKKSIQFLIEKFQETQLQLETEILSLVNQIKKTNTLSFIQYNRLSEEKKVELLRQLGQKASLVKEIDKLRESQKGKQILLEISKEQNAYYAIYREENYFQFILPRTSDFIIPKLVIKQISKLPAHFNKNEIYLDPTRLKGNLNLRKWKTGDRMIPQGMTGSKLISDIIKDAKTPSHRKENILILEDGSTILWCVGIRIGSNGIATEESEMIWKIVVE